ncbi:MAG: hypothetical protein J1E57_07025 [Prevotella sp.]|nr:hypothetical protein [Prevotella sp.]
MKKIYSTLMMLAMMVAALGFTACSSDDDGDAEGGNDDIALTITVDGQKHEFSREIVEGMDGFATWESHNGKNYLRIGTWSMPADLQFYYPYGIVPATFFSVGYDNFENDATDIKLVSAASNYCDYVSGSATVIKNDGKRMVVKFSNYKFTWNNGTRSIMYDGALTFALEY